jgi:hypothetical protein
LRCGGFGPLFRRAFAGATPGLPRGFCPVVTIIEKKKQETYKQIFRDKKA